MLQLFPFDFLSAEEDDEGMQLKVNVFAFCLQVWTGWHAFNDSIFEPQGHLYLKIRNASKTCLHNTKRREEENKLVLIRLDYILNLNASMRAPHTQSHKIHSKLP